MGWRHIWFCPVCPSVCRLRFFLSPELLVYILYWVKILTSIFFVFYSRSHPLKCKVIAIAEMAVNGRKRSKIAENHQKLPKNSWLKLYWSITFYWSEILTWYFVYYISKLQGNMKNDKLPQKSRKASKQLDIA